MSLKHQRAPAVTAKFLGLVCAQTPHAPADDCTKDQQSHGPRSPEMTSITWPRLLQAERETEYRGLAAAP